MNSEIIYLFMYDSGVRFTEDQLSGLLKNPEDFSKYEFSKPEPEEIATFNIPSIFNLKEETEKIGNTEYHFKVQVAIYPFGGFSIRIRHPIANWNNDIISKMTFNKEINEIINGVVSKTKKKVSSALSKKKEININQLSETYKFYYLEGDKSNILSKSKKLISGLLIDEVHADTLESEYIDYILGKNISYNSSNVLFVGWESAVMIDKENSYEHELLIAEISNLQLLEMRIYHQMLTVKLESSSSVLNSLDSGIMRMKNSEMAKMNRSLGSIYDNTRTVINNVNDTVFGLGEWYLSRVYSLFSNVFKLDVLKSSIEKDLEAIDNERKYISDIEAFWHEAFLERIVIVLIIVEIILEIFYLIK